MLPFAFSEFCNVSASLYGRGESLLSGVLTQTVSLKGTASVSLQAAGGAKTVFGGTGGPVINSTHVIYTEDVSLPIVVGDYVTIGGLSYDVAFWEVTNSHIGTYLVIYANRIAP